MGIVFPEGNFPSRAKRGYRELARGKYDSPRVEIFPREENTGRVGRYFPLWKYKFPWICSKFCNSSVGTVSGCRAKGPRFKSRVWLNAITNDFIIFDFYLLKHKFQENVKDSLLALIDQLIEHQTEDPTVPGSPISHTAGIFFPWKKISTRGESYCLVCQNNLSPPYVVIFHPLGDWKISCL